MKTILVIFAALMLLSCSYKHNCIDTMHRTCDGLCSCDGFECNRTHFRDYQIEVTQDSIYLYDGNKLVGTMLLEYDNDPLGTMILEDNQ